MTKRFYSNGKLLLSGEYAVLDGALSLALPTTYGQTLEVKTASTGSIKWVSRDHNNEPWFESEFDTQFKDATIEGSGAKNRLAKILWAAKQLNRDFLKDKGGYSVETKLDFPVNWGLGSSSTLINNIANWAGVDPYHLLANTFGGSGYDIACAKHNRPLLYKLEKDDAVVKEISFYPPFIDRLFFVYLNKKQDSREGISEYRKRSFDKKILADQISKITTELAMCENLLNFERLLISHEELLSEALGQPTVKAALFADYQGAIKSLGAWGGDFILATGGDQTEAYFKSLGYEVVIPYGQMILLS